jgi:hypothetical protein
VASLTNKINIPPVIFAPHKSMCSTLAHIDGAANTSVRIHAPNHEDFFNTHGNYQLLSTKP